MLRALPLLGVAFVVLKLCNVVHWSWLWVLAPFWAGLGLWMAFTVAILSLAVFAAWAKAD